MRASVTQECRHQWNIQIQQEMEDAVAWAFYLLMFLLPWLPAFWFGLGGNSQPGEVERLKTDVEKLKRQLALLVDLLEKQANNRKT